MIGCQVQDCPLQVSRLLIAAKLFKGLADPTRLSILQSLVHGPLRVVDLCKLTNRAQPNVSEHLACLRDCGLVQASPKGRETYYALVDSDMVSLLLSADGIVDRAGAQICACKHLD